MRFQLLICQVSQRLGEVDDVPSVKQADACSPCRFNRRQIGTHIGPNEIVVGTRFLELLHSVVQQRQQAVGIAFLNKEPKVLVGLDDTDNG